jgi:SAM-dependent methyltransferase
MREGEVRELFDEDYAKHYNQRFLLGDAYQKITEYEIRVLQELLRGAGSWLDVACGTGYILSRFPSVQRAGLDLSPPMVALARRDNPDAEFFIGDFLVERPEWHNKWDLVSCMWHSYSYVDTVEDVTCLLRNLASWTSISGKCFLPVCDLETLCGQRVPFTRELDTLDGTVKVEAVVWSCLEQSGHRQMNLIAPHKELFIQEFRKYFNRVSLIDYPRFDSSVSPSRPRAVIAEGKLSTP